MNLRELVRAAIRGDDLAARQWVKDAVRTDVDVSRFDAPTDLDDSEMAVCAGLIELIAARAGLAPPGWTASIGEAPAPVYLDADATARPRLRQLLEIDSPEPLRRRRVFAAPQYLDIRF